MKGRRRLLFLPPPSRARRAAAAPRAAPRRCARPARARAGDAAAEGGRGRRVESREGGRPRGSTRHARASVPQASSRSASAMAARVSGPDHRATQLRVAEERHWCPASPAEGVGEGAHGASPRRRAVNPSSREARRRSSLLDPARREKSARRRRWGVEGRGRRGEIGEGRRAPAPPRARPPVRRGARRFGARTTLEPPSLLAPSLPLLHRWSYSVAAGRDAAEGSRGVNVAARTARATASPSARGAGRYREERE